MLIFKKCAEDCHKHETPVAENGMTMLSESLHAMWVKRRKARGCSVISVIMC